MSLLVLTSVAFGSTITVNSAADAVVVDDGECTLREAIQAANDNTASGAAAGECAAGEASPTVDTVAFAIPGSGVHTITPTSSLPAITEAVLIDGYTQPGNGGPDASPNTLAVGDDAVLLIEISGASAPGSTMINITGPAGGSTVRGLVVNQTNGGNAFVVGFSVASSNNTISGNFIGLDPTGTMVPGSGPAPLVRFTVGSSNTFGGTTPAARNVMAGRSCCGNAYIVLDSAGSSVVQGNYFGTNASGTAALSIDGQVGGIVVLTSGNTIGGTASGAGNVIAGTSTAIRISGGALGGSNNVIQGNRIGTNAAGTAALGNVTGITTDNGGSDNLIGGSVAGAGNLISGNGTGIALFDGAAAYTIRGNLIGTDVSGTLPVPNAGDGILLFTAPAGTSIGGTAPGDGNIIAFNGGQGVSMINSPTFIGLAILGNSFFSNGGLGISLDTSSTPIGNDVGDSDTGANNLQNFPVFDTFVFGGGTSTTGTLNSTPDTTFRIEVFANDACDPSGFGEGQTFVGANDAVMTDGTGNASFTVTFAQPLPPGTILTATATAPDGSTSEFSDCTQAPPTTTTTSTSTTFTSTTSTSTTTTTTSTTTSTSSSTTTTTSTTTSTSTSNSTTSTSTSTTSTTTLPTFVDAFILPRRVLVRANATAPARSKLVTAGTFDTGSQVGNLGAAATLQVGQLTVSVPGLTPVGRRFRFEQEGLRFIVTPAATQSSKAHFKMALQRDLTGLVDLDAPLTLRFVDPLIDGRGVVRLGHGHFVLGRRPGTVLAPRLYVFRVRAVLAGSGQDRVTVRVGFATDGNVPEVAPDATLTFGDTFQVTVPSSAFVRRGTRFSGQAADGHTRVVLDYQRETLVLRAQRVDLGAFVEGSQPVRVGVTLGQDVRTDDVRMVRTGRALKY